MSKSEIPKTPENTSDGFLGFKNMLSSFKKGVKEFLTPQQSIEQKKEKITLKAQQESGKDRMDLQKLQKEALIGKEKREIKSELLGLNEEITPTKKNIASKNIPFQYTPMHIESANWLQNNQDKRIAAPWIAKSADDLRNDIKESPILQYFLG